MYVQYVDALRALHGVACESPGSRMSGTRRAILDSREALASTWRRLLPPGTRCALALYPDHWNAGDAAIWWGTRTLLQELGVSVGYACDPWSYSPDALRSALPEGPVLILGGGNFGDVYLPEVSLRARILGDFPDREVIQLPQSIWFRTEQGVSEVAALLGARSRVTLLLRDAESLAFAQSRFVGTACELCPDATMALDLEVELGADRVPVLALWRRDLESSGELPPLPSGWLVRDWTAAGGVISQEDARPLSTASRQFREWVGRPSGCPPPEHCPIRRRMAWRHITWMWDQLAEDRARRGLRILATGRVVITNRLHAHLLCLLAGIPHVVCDTSNGKVFAYRDTWLSSISSHSQGLARYAATPEEAVQFARALLDDVGT